VSIVVQLLTITIAVVWFPVRFLLWFLETLLEAARGLAGGVFDDE
jgi:hypothetical protein